MIDLTTPSLLFSAISLILLAYTNRFLSYASLVRSLKEKLGGSPAPKEIAQIQNLRKRLYLTRAMQFRLRLPANHRRLGIWHRPTAAGRLSLRLYLGNQHLRKGPGDSSGGLKF